MTTFWEKVCTIWRRLRAAPEGGVYLQQDQADWKATFQDAAFLANGPRQLEEAQSRMIGHLGRAYEAYERLGQRYTSLLQGVMEAVDFCEGLNPPSKEIQAVHRQLLSLLAKHAVSPWSPPVGKLAPEGCEIVGIIPSKELPPGTVQEVVRPGYRKDRVILRRPQVIVTTSPPEEVRPEVIQAEAEVPPEVASEREQPESATEAGETPGNGQEEDNEPTSHRD